MMRSHRELWKRVQRALTGEALGRTVAGLVLAEVDRWAMGRPQLWTDVELDALKARVVRDSRARGTYIRAIITGCQARGIEPPPLEELDPLRDVDFRIYSRWYIIARVKDYEEGRSEILPPSAVEDAWRDYETWRRVEAAAGHQYPHLPKAGFLQWYPQEFESLKNHVAAAPRHRQAYQGIP